MVMLIPLQISKVPIVERQRRRKQKEHLKVCLLLLETAILTISLAGKDNVNDAVYIRMCTFKILAMSTTAMTNRRH